MPGAAGPARPQRVVTLVTPAGSLSIQCRRNSLEGPWAGYKKN